MLGTDDDGPLGRGVVPPQRGAPVVQAPGPGVAEPHLRQQVERGRLRAVVGRGDLHDDVPRGGLGVGDDDVEEPVLVEHAGVGQLVLGVLHAALAVRPHQLLVGEGGLRVAVEAAGVGVGGQPLEVPPVLLDVLAVVALRVRQPEQPLLEPVVLPVPHRHGDVEVALEVAQAGDPVLPPAVGPQVGVVERQVRPGVPVGGVVLPDGAPLPSGDVGAPAAPGRPGVVGVGQSSVLGGGHRPRLGVRRHTRRGGRGGRGRPWPAAACPPRCAPRRAPRPPRAAG
ncbi:hypothetical protein [Ornithinimicrobium kibberense]|uniref:hypothetical protein n=1 Tax=Ornithinimicrobium kibberense TaxID=282060 RepID=UPI0036204317